MARDITYTLPMDYNSRADDDDGACRLASAAVRPTEGVHLLRNRQHPSIRMLFIVFVNAFRKFPHRLRLLRDLYRIAVGKEFSLGSIGTDWLRDRVSSQVVQLITA